MPRVLLINPRTANRYYHISGTKLFDRAVSRFFQKRYDGRFTIPPGAHCTSMPPVTLLGLQALFRDRCAIQVLDEQVASIDYDTKVASGGCQVGTICTLTARSTCITTLPGVIMSVALGRPPVDHVCQHR